MMTGEVDEALKSAVGALKLKDIVLNEARFRRPCEMERDAPVQELVKRAVEFKRIPATGQTSECLRVLVGLGIRFTAVPGSTTATTLKAEVPIYLEIEADFVAQYELKNSLTEDAIKVFASYNAVHNVWPFWRQHVYDIVNRGRLGPIDVPLYSGNTVGGVAVSESAPTLALPQSVRLPKVSKQHVTRSRKRQA
jgi:hypothetical protein